MRRTIGVTLGQFCLFLSLTGAALAQPTLTKVFTPSTIGPGSVSTATFTITNGSASLITGLAFSDTLPVLPGPLSIADPANASTDCDLGISGSLSAPDGGSTITLSDARLGAFLSCTVTVDVTASTPGAHTNAAVTLSSSAGSSMSLPVDLTVDITRPGFSKSFAPSSIPLGDRSTLTFTFDNSLGALALTFLAFTDNFPAGIEVADPANTATTCGTFDFTLTAVPGTDVVTLFAVGSAVPGFEVVPVGGSCTITLDVVGVGAGSLDNLSGELTYRSGFSFSIFSAGKASATLEVTVAPLALQKSFTDDPVPPGGSVTLDFTLDNFNRLFSATGLAFTDDLTTLVPALAGLTFDSLLANDCGGSVAGAGGTSISFTGGTLAPEASCTISVSLSVPVAATPGSYTNTTTAITATVDGSPVVGNMASDDLFVEPAPVLTKVFMGDPVNPGDTIVLEFTVSNTSTTSSATEIAFVDMFDSVLATASATPGNGCCGAGSICTFTPLFNPPLDSVIPAQVAISGGILAPAGMAGDSCTFSITLDVNAGASPGIYPNVTSEITATVDGATRTGDPASDDFTVIAAPSLSKSFTNDPVAPGGTATLEFTLTHSSNATTDATGITFTDDLTFLAGLTANLPSTPDPPCGAGSMLTGSAGDTLLTLLGGTLVPGGSCTFSVTLDVPIGAAPGSHANTTSGVAATVEGLVATSAPASDDLKVAGLTFTKEFLGDPVIAGEMVTLRFTLGNISPTDDATAIFFTDSLDAVLPGIPDLTTSLPPSADTCGGTPGLLGTGSLSYVGGSLTIGSTCTIEFDVLVPAGAADGDYSNVTSSLTATQGGAVTIDPATDNLTINSNLLLFTKAFTDDPVAPGDSVTLEFTLTNADASQAASSIDFTDDLGATLSGLTFDSVLLDTCGGTVSGTGSDMITVTGAGLSAGGTCTLRVSLTVPGGSAAGIYTNTTSGVTGTLGGFSVVGDAASDALEIIQLLTFSKSFDGPTTATGTAILTFTITNPGADMVTGIAFSDDLDAVISGLIAISLPALPCGLGSSLTGVSFLSFTGGELPPLGGMCSFDVEVLVPASASAGTFPNTTSDLFRDGLEVAEPATADLTIEPPPVFAKGFAPLAVGLGQQSTLTLTIDNSASALSASSLDFTDSLPAGMLVAVVPTASTTCTGGALTAIAGTAVVSYNGGSVAAGITCQVQVDVVTSALGMLVNTTGDLMSSAGNSGTASAALTVDPQPGFSKSFAPDPILVGGVSTLTLTIDNSASTTAATALDFTDNLPAGMVVATPSSAATSCVGGTLTAADGAATITYNGGSVAAMATCTVTVEVSSDTQGVYLNTTGDLTSDAGNAGSASATLTVVGELGFSKQFVLSPVLPGGMVELAYTITNPSPDTAVMGLAFTDDLDAVIPGLVAVGLAGTDPCGVGSTFGGTSLLTLSGGMLPASGSCTFSAILQVPPTAIAGTYPSVTSQLTGTAGGGALSVSGAAADLVIEFFGFSKAFQDASVTAGSISTLIFTLSNPDPANAATDLTFSDDLDAVLAGMQTFGLPQSDVCGVGSLVAGTSVLTLTGGSLAPLGSCVFTVDFTVPGDATDGTVTNQTSPLEASVGGVTVVGGPGDVAVAVVEVRGLVLEIPTLGGWGLLLLALGLGWGALRRISAG